MSRIEKALAHLGKSYLQAITKETHDGGSRLEPHFEIRYGRDTIAPDGVGTVRLIIDGQSVHKALAGALDLADPEMEWTKDTQSCLVYALAEALKEQVEEADQ